MTERLLALLSFLTNRTIAQLREPAQEIADQIETLMCSPASSMDVDA